MNAFKAKFLTGCVIGVRIFSFEQKYQIYSGFKRYNLTKEQVKVYARKGMSSDRMSYCKHALVKGFSVEEMKEWLDMNLNGYIFRYAIEGRQMGIPKEKVQEYANTKISVGDSFKRYIELIQEYRCK